MVWTVLIWLRIRPKAGCWGHGNRPSCFMNVEECVSWLDYWFFIKVCTPSYLVSCLEGEAKSRCPSLVHQAFPLARNVIACQICSDYPHAQLSEKWSSENGSPNNTPFRYMLSQVYAVQWYGNILPRIQIWMTIFACLWRNWYEHSASRVLGIRNKPNLY
jgi:hypothetical protein